MPLEVAGHLALATDSAFTPDMARPTAEVGAEVAGVARAGSGSICCCGGLLCLCSRLLCMASSAWLPCVMHAASACACLGD
jgi:hypothetical protein